MSAEQTSNSLSYFGRNRYLENMDPTIFREEDKHLISYSI